MKASTLKIKIGKGVLGKDGEPFAPNCMWYECSDGFRRFVDCELHNVAVLLLQKSKGDDITAIGWIDGNNEEVKITL